MSQIDLTPMIPMDPLQIPIISSTKVSHQNLRPNSKLIKKKSKEFKKGEICTTTGRKLVDYDWKYGMRHMPIWKTNQLLNSDFQSFQNINPKDCSNETEKLKWIAKPVNIYRIQHPSDSTQHNNKKKHKRYHTKAFSNTYSKLPSVECDMNNEKALNDMNSSLFAPTYKLNGNT